MKGFKEWADYFYFLMIFIWALAGCLFAMRTIRHFQPATTTDKIQYYFYSIGSSMLIGWLVCELCFYANLPIGLCGALSSVSGLVGANTIANYILALVKKKLNIQNTTHDEQNTQEQKSEVDLNFNLNPSNTQENTQNQDQQYQAKEPENLDNKE